MKLLKFAQLPATPWKNGGGTTRELDAYPTGAGFDSFHWRASIADVGQAGPFSAFPGIDRIILLLEGDGMDLEFGDRTHALRQPWHPIRFRGEEPVHARMAGGACRDFNLMLRRGLVDGDMTVRREQGGIDVGDNESVLLLCAAGRWQASLPDGARHELGAFDALSGPSPAGPIAAHPMEPGSALIVVRIRHRNGSRGSHVE